MSSGRGAAGFDEAIRFAAEFVAKPWGGGEKLRALGVRAPSSPPTGEVWLVSDVPGRSSRIVSGPGAGGTLDALLRSSREAVLGRADSASAPFPLLVKLLEIQGALSLQVHPDSAQSLRHGDGPSGKFEAWSVLRVDREARVTLGFDAAYEPDDVRRFVATEKLESHLQTFVPEAGDAYVIAPGLVHAARGGILLLEVQETADVTYRLYDWGAKGLDGKPRELHVDKALAVAELGVRRGGRPPRPPVATVAPGVRRQTIVPPGAGPFVYDRVELDAGASLRLGDEGAVVVVGLGGEGALGGTHIGPGDAALWPAAAPRTTLSAAMPAVFAIATPVPRGG